MKITIFFDRKKLDTLIPNFSNTKYLFNLSKYMQ